MMTASEAAFEKALQKDQARLDAFNGSLEAINDSNEEMVYVKSRQRYEPVSAALNPFHDLKPGGINMQRTAEAMAEALARQVSHDADRMADLVTQVEILKEEKELDKKRIQAKEQQICRLMAIKNDYFKELEELKSRTVFGIIFAGLCNWFKEAGRKIKAEFCE